MASFEEQLAAALTNRQQQNFQTNPWIVAAQNFQPIPVQQGSNNLESGIASGAMGIAKGLMALQGINSARQDFSKDAAGLTQALQSKNVPQALLNLQGYESLAPAYVQEQQQRAMKSQDAFDIAYQQQLAQQRAARELQVQQAADYLGRQGQQVASPQQAPYAAPNIPLGAPNTPDIQAGAAPTPAATQVSDPLSSVRQKTIELIQSGVPVERASKQALDEVQFLSGQQEKELAPQRERDKEELKNLEINRAKATDLISIGENATTWAPYAGATGSGPVSWVRRAVGQASQDISDDQRLKEYATKMLDVYTPDVIAAKKPQASGNPSNYESQLFIGGGPGSSQLPEVNIALGQAYKARGNYERDRADFKSEWYSRYHTLAGSDQAWQQFAGDRPLIEPDPNNPMIPKVTDERFLKPSNWKEYFFGGGSQQTPQPQPPQATEPTPTAPGPQSQLAPQGGQQDVSAMIDAAAQKYGVPVELARAVAQQESGGNQSAISPKGAIGVMQLMPGTAKDLGVDPTDPAQNIDGGVRYLAQQLQKFKDPKLALAAYNAGPVAVAKAGGVPNFKETKNYVKAISDAVGIQNAQAEEPTPTASPAKQQQPKGPSPLQQAFKDYVYNPAGQLLQGATANLGDEAVARLQSLRSGKDYEQELLAERKSLEKYQKEHPRLAAGLQIGGSLMTTPLIPGGAVAQGASRLGTIKKLATTGAAIGGLYGYGAGQDSAKTSPRALSSKDAALQGAFTGAITAPLVYGGVKAVEGALKSEPAQQAYNLARQLLGSEQGAVFSNRTINNLSKDETAALKMLGGSRAEDLMAALNKMKAPGASDNMVLGEAVDRPATYLYAKKLANTPGTVAGEKGPMDIAQQFIEGRTAEAPARVEKLFNKVSGKSSAYDAATSATNGAKEILLAERQLRSKKFSPLFQEAISEVPILKSPAIDTILENPKVSSAIKAVKSDPDLANLPDNHSAVVQGALEYLGGKIQSLKAAKANPANPQQIRILVKAKEALENAVEQTNPALTAARAAFREGSTAINELTDAGIQVLNTAAEGDSIRAVEKVFRMSPEEITKLRGVYAERQPEAWNDMIKAYVVRATEKTSDNATKSMLRPLIGSKVARARLRAAVGDELYNKIEPSLSLESKYADAARKYFAGSPTQPLQDATEKTNWIINLAQSVASPIQSVKKGLEYLTKPAANEDQMRELAKIFFDPSRGQQFLSKAIPLQKNVDAYISAIEKAAKGTRKLSIAATASRTGGK